MSLPTFTMRQLLEAGVHFGHHTRRWNPKMDPYIFGKRNNIHIINLEKTVPMLYEALDAIQSIAKNGGKFLFVGTKRSASELIAQAAINCGQYYVNHRWLGGMLTNWETVSKSIRKLKNLEERIETGEINSLTKKERLQIERQKEKLDLTLGGIKNMNGIPDAIFIIDTNKESIAVLEANNLNIPVIAICDTNTNPSGVDYPIPGNDDALRAISLYCDLVAASVLKGLESNLEQSGVDIGESEVIVEENTSQNINSDNIPEVVSADPVALDSDNPENVVKD
ncbi:30S ribosomal protein S2 [Alphaproteobacteria bacterium]|jgi:small subunit ribosomal protein S2|nr:30S ribosomal protein S2 [Alphaproteobacteria bacterium]MDB2683833.1 30S ribosomal protein S2 [Alphaproteobacteria bacterium]